MTASTAYDFESTNVKAIRTIGNVPPSDLGMANVATYGARFLVDSKHNIWAPGPVPILIPGTLSGVPRVMSSPALIEGENGTNFPAGSPWPLENSLASSDMLGNVITTPALATQMAYAKLGSIGGKNTSATNAAQVISLDLKQCCSCLSVYMLCSAGTATLTVEVSSDAVHYLTVDSIAAAASITKNYSAASLATTIAINVVAFRWITLLAGTAGAGNTTDLWVGAK